MRNLNRSTIAAVLFLFFAATNTYAAAPTATSDDPRELAIELGAPFHDRAILQRGMKVPVWGWSAPGTKVTVQFAGQNMAATADKDGKWTVHLDPLKASAVPAEMVVTEAGGNTETLTDILVGEVWLASGQSNMQWLVSSSGLRNIPREIQARVKEGTEKMPIIREVQVPGWGATIRPVEKAKAVWSTNWNSMSAIAFGFAYEIEKDLDVPIGIVNCSFSQTPIEGWTHELGFKGGEDAFTKSIYHGLSKLQDPASPEHKAAWEAYGKAVREWAKEADERAGKKLPPNPMPDTPGEFRFGNRDATWLYNAKTHPMAPFAIRGVIWNQGYHNSADGLVYRNNLRSLVQSFRAVWGEPDLPVYFHQFYCPNNSYDDGISLNPMAEMRLGTWLAHKDISNAAMASQIDIAGGVHYQDKLVPAQRLAYHALKNEYGKDILASGPMYKGYKVEGKKLVLELDHSLGLRVGQYMRGEIKTIENGEGQVTLFYLADENRKWHRATIKIVGNTIELVAPAVKIPRGVAYGTNGVGFVPNIYNKAMLPLTPFIVYDHKLVISDQWDWDHIKIPSKPIDVMVWPEPYLKRGDIEVDITTFGLGFKYQKLPLIASQFRDGGVLQAGVPIRIYGAAIPGSVVKVSFAGQEQTIHVEMDQTQGYQGFQVNEWEATFPAMEASDKPLSIKATCHVDGELVHDRRASNIVIGDVWYVAVNNAVMPPRPWNPTYTSPTGPVRTLQSASVRSFSGTPDRYKLATGSRIGRYFARWWDADGLAKELGDRIHAKTGKPVGVIVMNTKGDVQLKDYVGYEWLGKVDAWKADKQDIAKQYNPDTTFYKANVDAYLKNWQDYWQKVANEPDFAQSNASGGIPGFPWRQIVVNSTATQRYNWAITNFSPGAFKGIICLTPKTFIGEDEGAGFGEQFSVMANCWKDAFAYGKESIDPYFVYVLPSKDLAPKLTKPAGITGASTAVELSAWPEIKEVDPGTRLPIISDDIKAVLDAAIESTYQ